MKGNLLRVGMIPLIFCLSITFLIGCAKKSGMKTESTVTREQKPAATTTTKVPAPLKDDKEAQEMALREQTLRDQKLREAPVTEATEAADRDKKGAAVTTLKELQIPDVYFDFDKYNLTPEAQAILKAAAPAYLRYTDYKLVVEGHGDERGTGEYNLALGQKRADEAAKFLVVLGIGRERITTISYGKEKPLDKGHDEAAWAKNRRAHFVVLSPGK
jgi:peptidoglycan-associated lipoprotein